MEQCIGGKELGRRSNDRYKNVGEQILPKMRMEMTRHFLGPTGSP